MASPTPKLSTAGTYLFRLIPPKYRANQTAIGLVQAIAGPLEQWRTLAETTHRLIDPQTTREDWLDWLMQIVALPPFASLASGQKRTAIAAAISIWTRKGPANVLEEYLKAITNVTAFVTTEAPDAFIAGVSLAGDVCGVVSPYYHFVVNVPTGAIVDSVGADSESEVRRILKPVVPIFCSYDVVFF